MVSEAEEWPLCTRGLLRDHSSPVANIKMQALKQLRAPKSSRSQDESSSSSNMNGKEAKHSQEDEQSSPLHPRSSSAVSPDFGTGRNSSLNGYLSLTEYKVYENDGLADASTQTEENVSSIKTQETCVRGISIDDGSLDNESSQAYQNKASTVKEKSKGQSESISPQHAPSGASSSSGKDETLESFIRADASKMNSYRILEEEEIQMPANATLKATKILLQLISCGSISVKDNNFGLIPTYHPRFPPSKLPSPMLSTSMMLGEFDYLSNPRVMGLRLKENEYFSGSLIEARTLREDGDCLVALKSSSSFNADRACKALDSADNGASISGRSKCIPLSIKASLAKQP